MATKKGTAPSGKGNGSKRKTSSVNYMKNKKKKKSVLLHRRSNVRKIIVKCYDEQLPEGWEVVKKRIQNTDTAVYWIFAIKHDMDEIGDDFWKPSKDKPHYHFLVIVKFKKEDNTTAQFHLDRILKDIGIVFRPGDDDELLANHNGHSAIEICKDITTSLMYLTHETDKALDEGKFQYDREQVVSNLSLEETNHLRQGYISLGGLRKPTDAHMAELDKKAFEIGYKLEDFAAWYNTLSFMERNSTKMRTVRESYHRGQDFRLEEKQEMVRLCIFIQGEKNIGKTYAAKQALRNHNPLSVGGGGTGKFDSLSPRNGAIIIDDDKCPNLLNMSDNYICRAYKRGKDNPVWCGRYLVVTSNVSFSEWLNDCGIPSGIREFSNGERYNAQDAIETRFYICKVAEESFDGNTVKILKVLTPSKRGKVKEQKERLEMFKAFQEEYEKSINDYNPEKEVMDYNPVDKHNIRIPNWTLIQFYQEIAEEYGKDFEELTKDKDLTYNPYEPADPDDEWYPGKINVEVERFNLKEEFIEYLRHKEDYPKNYVDILNKEYDRLQKLHNQMLDLQIKEFNRE